MLLLIEPIHKKKSPSTDTLDWKNPALDRKNLANINEAAKMPGRNKDTKMPDKLHIPPENKYTTSN